MMLDNCKSWLSIIHRHENTLKIGQSTNEAARPAKLKRALSTLHICSVLNTAVVNENTICQKLHSKQVGMAFKNIAEAKTTIRFICFFSALLLTMMLASSIYERFELNLLCKSRTKKMLVSTLLEIYFETTNSVHFSLHHYPILFVQHLYWCMENPSLTQ